MNRNSRIYTAIIVVSTSDRCVSIPVYLYVGGSEHSTVKTIAPIALLCKAKKNMWEMD